LRNVAVTRPYFHDGRAQTLEKAVRTMVRGQLGMTLSSEEIKLIIQFLHTLTGEYQGRPVGAPGKKIQAQVWLNCVSVCRSWRASCCSLPTCSSRAGTQTSLGGHACKRHCRICNCMTRS